MSHLMNGLMNYKRLLDRHAYVSQLDWYVVIHRDDYLGSKKNINNIVASHPKYLGQRSCYVITKQNSFGKDGKYKSGISSFMKLEGYFNASQLAKMKK